MTSSPRPASESARGRNKAASHVDVIVGQRIRLRRAVLQLSQPEVAEHIGITQQQLQKYETGLNRVSASRLHDLSVALDVPVGWFFAEVPAEPLAALSDVLEPHRSCTPGQPAILEDDAATLLRYYESIEHPDGKNLLLALAQYLSDTKTRK